MKNVQGGNIRSQGAMSVHRCIGVVNRLKSSTVNLVFTLTTFERVVAECTKFITHGHRNEKIVWIE